VAAKVLTGIESRAEYLRRLSVVFAVELRLKIVTELYMREMSPTQFFKEFGGGSVSRVTANFERLVEHGWLRYIRSESGGSRRGGVERFYRATELAIFDCETWSLLPYPVRVSFSWSSFKQLAERVRVAMEAGTFDARPDRHLTWTPLLLDQFGWEQVIAAVDALFLSLFEEQADAKLRIYHSGEKPILASVVLIAFESPTRSGWRIGPSLVESRQDPLIPYPERLSKVFADELCLTILAELSLREMSPTQFHTQIGGDSVVGVRRRFKRLERFGWLKKTNEKTGGKRRGAKEHFYRATGPAIFDNSTWADVPDSVKAAHSWTTFERLSEKVTEAIGAGTFDAREDRYLTWSLLRLDQQGWEKVIAAIEALFAFIFEERDRADDRMAASGEKPVTMTVGLAAFEAPKDSVKEP
jgi:hypothetical protein